MERASVSTLPFAIDDPAPDKKKQCILEDIIVDLYNGGRVASMRKGVTIAESIPILALNHSLQQEER